MMSKGGSYLENRIQSSFKQAIEQTFAYNKVIIEKMRRSEAKKEEVDFLFRMVVCLN